MTLMKPMRTIHPRSQMLKRHWMRCQQGTYFEKKCKRPAKSLSQKEKNIFLMKHIKRPANEVQQMKISIS